MKIQTFTSAMDIGGAPEIVSGLEIDSAFGPQRHWEKKEGEKQKGGQQKGEQLKGGRNTRS